MEKQYGGGEKPPLSNFNEAQKKAVCHRDAPDTELLAQIAPGRTLYGIGRTGIRKDGCHHGTSGMDDSEFADPA